MPCLNGVVIAICLLCLSSSAWAARGDANAGTAKKSTDDVFVKCSVNIRGADVIPKEKFRALADNLADPQFAKFDTECKGKAKNPGAVTQSQKGQKQATDRYLNDLRTVVQDRSTVPGTSNEGIPADVARRDFGMEKTPPLPVLFRDAYSTYSLLSPPPASQRATGTQISYTRDYLNANDIISAKGAIIGWNILSVSADSNNPLASMGVTRMLWAPGVEFDQSRNHSNPKVNTDYVAFKFIGEIEKEAAGSLFPLQYFRYSGYWKTDSRGQSKIGGGYVEWEPYNLDLAIGVAPLLFGGPVQFRWSPIAHFETEKVFSAGALTTVHTGDVYARGGPILRADVFFADGLLKDLVLGAQYRYLWNVADGGSANNIHYFQADVAYNLDPAGNAALSTSYRDGITPGNSTRVRDVKTGLTVKY